MHHKQYAQNSCNTVYPRNMVCFRCIGLSVNTLHKGDKEIIIIIIIIIIISKTYTLDTTHTQ
jgi:hypothetical protein